MPTEIERKFLTVDHSWRPLVFRAVHLRDGLLAYSDGRKVRVRFYDDRATLTVKGPRRGLSRDEFEYEIPACDGLMLLEQHCAQDVVEKTRHHVMHEGFEWVIDEYDGLLKGVILAEIELPTEDTTFDRPAWLGQEVTGTQEYRKINMLKARREAMAAPLHPLPPAAANA